MERHRRAHLVAAGRRLVLAGALTLLLAPVARGEDDPVRATAARLGTPARPEAVDEALLAVTAGEESPTTLARALGAARGVEALHGLRRLIGHRDPEVRLEALASAERVALRSDGLAEELQEILADASRKQVERLAAAGTLAIVGDGRDMDALLAIAAREEESQEVRSAAFRTMASISGARIPYVHARWSYWWRKKQLRGVERIARALASLKGDPSPAAVEAAEAELVEHGWIDLVAVRDASRAWLRGADRRLGPVACRLAQHLRLADLGPELAALGRKAVLPDELRQAGKEAVESLGVVPVEGLR